MDSGYALYADIITHITNFHQNGDEFFRTNMKSGISSYYQNVARDHDWPNLRRISAQTPAFVAGQARFYWPHDVMVPLAMFDVTNDIMLQPGRLEAMAYEDISFFDTQGLAEKFAAAGDLGRNIDFHTSAEKLLLVSSSAADTTQQVRIYGCDPDLLPLTELVTLNGTTPVATVNTYTDYYHAAVSASKAGKVTISGQTSGKVYTKIPIDEKTVRYKVSYISENPIGANSLALIYRKYPRALNYDEDSPEIPVSEYLKEAGLGYGYEFNKKHELAAQHYQKAAGILESIINDAGLAEDGRVPSRPEPYPRMSMTRFILKSGSAI